MFHMYIDKFRLMTNIRGYEVLYPSTNYLAKVIDDISVKNFLLSLATYLTNFWSFLLIFFRLE